MNKGLLYYAVLTGDWKDVPPKLANLTVDDLKKLVIEGRDILEALGNRPKSIIKLPPELIGEDGLLFKDKELRIRTIHLATENGSLSIIPKKYLTQENLYPKGLQGYNTFHLAAGHGCIKDIPKELLDDSNLTSQSSNGYTPLELGIKASKELKNKITLTPTGYGPNILEKLKNINEGINLMLNNLSNETLTEMIKSMTDRKTLSVIKILPFLKKEFLRRKVLKIVNSGEKDIEI